MPVPSRRFRCQNDVIDRLKEQTYALAKALKVCGLMNIQFAVKDGEIYVLEVNPRASRTVPFVSKATGLNLAQAAARVMVGKTLEEQGITAEPVPRYVSVKEAVFPFSKFPGVDIVLGPEMRSTGEVMGIAMDFPPRSPRANWRPLAVYRPAARSSSVSRPETAKRSYRSLAPGRHGLSVALHRRHCPDDEGAWNQRRGCTQDSRRPA